MDKKVLFKIVDESRGSSKSGKVHYIFLDSINDISKFDLECTDWDGSDCSSYLILVNDKQKLPFDTRKRRDEVFEELMMAISERFDVVALN